MTKPELVYAVMQFPEALNVEVKEDEPGNVIIVVVVDPLTTGDLYDLRVRIQQALEPNRPMGVGFEVRMQRVDEYERAIAQEKAQLAKSLRTRFSAVAEELTAPISPVKKPPSNTPVAQRVPKLYEDTVRVESNGSVSPCMKCGCQAFTLDTSGTRATCRGCPLPAPVYAIEYADRSSLVVNTYKCWSCGKTSSVTMELAQVNLYCGGCNKLALHDLKQTKVFSGAKATFTFNGKTVEGFAENVEAVEFGPSDPVKEVNSFAEAAEFYGNGTFEPITFSTEATKLDTAKGADLDMLARVYGQDPPRIPPTLKDVVEATIKRVAAAAAMPSGLLQPDAHLDLMETFRKKLDLFPFKVYEEQQRNENRVRGLKADDWDRRTGRTTRGLLYRIAEFMVGGDLRALCVVGHTTTYTRDLARVAGEMVERLKLPRKMDIKVLMPDDFQEEGFDYRGRQKMIVFVDHTFQEKRERYRKAYTAPNFEPNMRPQSYMSIDGAVITLLEVSWTSERDVDRMYPGFASAGADRATIRAKYEVNRRAVETGKSMYLIGKEVTFVLNASTEPVRAYVTDQKYEMNAKSSTVSIEARVIAPLP